MPWLDPKANSIEDATGAEVEDSISTSVLLVVPGPRTIGGPSNKGQSSFYGLDYVRTKLCRKLKGYDST
jgi:hypothetical protein